MGMLVAEDELAVDQRRIAPETRALSPVTAQSDGASSPTCV